MARCALCCSSSRRPPRAAICGMFTEYMCTVYILMVRHRLRGLCANAAKVTKYTASDRQQTPHIRRLQSVGALKIPVMIMRNKAYETAFGETTHTSLHLHGSRGRHGTVTVLATISRRPPTKKYDALCHIDHLHGSVMYFGNPHRSTVMGHAHLAIFWRYISVSPASLTRNGVRRTTRHYNSSSIYQKGDA